MPVGLSGGDPGVAGRPPPSLPEDGAVPRTAMFGTVAADLRSRGRPFEPDGEAAAAALLAGRQAVLDGLFTVASPFVLNAALTSFNAVFRDPQILSRNIYGLALHEVQAPELRRQGRPHFASNRFLTLVENIAELVPLPADEEQS